MDAIDYLTITQFAERVGVTPQAVYKWIKNRLLPFVKEINGQKMLHVDALKIIKPTDTTNTAKTQASTGSQVELIEALQRTIEILNTQLNVKDRQINDLNERLEQALKTTGLNHYVQAKQIEAPGQRRSWFERVFKRDL